jgi:hypothetical protein
LDLKRLPLYFQTLRHLKPTQVWHQVYYRVRPLLGRKTYSGIPKALRPVEFTSGISTQRSFLGNQAFRLLNLEKQFEDIIDWNYAGFGKLWTYNLNYFEFLGQEGMTRDVGLSLIRDYLSKAENRIDGLEPYPISLRGINWVKFLSKHGVEDQEINTLLYRDYCRLSDTLEYHLLANHLLENGFSLLFGAYYFQEEKFFLAAKRILKRELKEQILSDGAHYELSPMYHQIILYRVLDCYNLLQKNNWESLRLLPLLRDTALTMLGWLQAFCWKDGNMPCVNDAAPGIAPDTRQLLDYAAALGLQAPATPLGESGYRKFNQGDFEVLVDAGQILPSYQPGHAHADSLQVLMRYQGQPVLVDTGASTYEKNERRQLERSTAAHNTVTLNGKDSSQVWGGFRVGKRAHSTIQKEFIGHIQASHNGFSCSHTRTVDVQAKKVLIVDSFYKRHLMFDAQGHLHFHPDVPLFLEQKNIVRAGPLKILFKGVKNIEIGEFAHAQGFNNTVKSRKVVYNFYEDCSLELIPNEN